MQYLNKKLKIFWLKGFLNSSLLAIIGMMKSLWFRSFDYVWNRFPSLNRPVWKAWYHYASSLDKEASMVFMNYGYADGGKNKLKHADEKDRYCIQLYHHVVDAVNLKGKELLKVGCGRGGGASYIVRCLNPKSMTGTDFSRKAIEFCEKHYSTRSRSFFVGVAECLPFEDEKFDVVINIESSHCYVDMEKFLGEVFRILKPSGHFLFADFRRRSEMKFLVHQLKKCGFKLIRKEDITKNVLKALDLDNKRKNSLIEQKVPKIFQKTFMQFAGVNGSEIYESFKSREREYFNFIIQKK